MSTAKPKGKTASLGKHTAKAAAPLVDSDPPAITATATTVKKRTSAVGAPLKRIQASARATYVTYVYRTYKSLRVACSAEGGDESAAPGGQYAWIFEKLGVDPAVFNVRRSVYDGPFMKSTKPIRMSKPQLYHLCNQVVKFIRETLRGIGSGTSTVQTIKPKHILNAILPRLRMELGLPELANSLSRLADAVLERFRGAAGKRKTGGGSSVVGSGVEGETPPTTPKPPTAFPSLAMPAKICKSNTRTELKALLARNNVGAGAVEVIACVFIWAIVLAQQGLANAFHDAVAAGKSTHSLIGSKHGITLNQGRLPKVLKDTGLDKIVQPCDEWNQHRKLSVRKPFVSKSVVAVIRSKHANIRMYHGVTEAIQMCGRAYLSALNQGLEQSETARSGHRITAEDVRSVSGRILDMSALGQYLMPEVTTGAEDGEGA